MTFWVGLVPVSLLFGPVWRVANPLRLLHRGLRVVLPAPPGAARLPALGLWPAAASLVVFLWLELVFPGRAEPVTVGRLPGPATPSCTWRWRPGSARSGSPAASASRSTRRSSPASPPGDGATTAGWSSATRWPTRWPARSRPGLAAVVVVLLGSTAFDGLSRTVFWQTGPGAANDSLSGTLGLLVMIALVGALYLLGTRLSGRLARQPPGVQPRRYAATVIPIVLGYTVAHYFSLLMLDGQATWILASNPFGVAASTCSAPTATSSTCPRSAPTRSPTCRSARSCWATSWV